MKQRNKITIKRIPDYDADLSWIGTFDNEAKDEFAIKHDESNSRTYNYFNPQKGAVTSKKEAMEDYKRMMAYENGEWGMIGIKAFAEIATSQDGKIWQLNTISSGGLWGIEDDSDEKYLMEEENNQLTDLRDVLAELGFTGEYFDNVQIVKES